MIYVPFNRLLTIGAVAWCLQKGEEIPEMKAYNTWLVARVLTTSPKPTKRRPMTNRANSEDISRVYGSPNKARFWQIVAYNMINGDFVFSWLEATQAGQQVIGEC